MSFYSVGSDKDGNLVVLTDMAEGCGGLTKITLPPSEAEGLVRQAAFLLQTQRLPLALPSQVQAPLPVLAGYDTLPAPPPVSVAPVPVPVLTPAARALQEALEEAAMADATAEAMAADAAALRAKREAGSAEPNPAWAEAQRKAEEERDLRRAKLGIKTEE